MASLRFCRRWDSRCPGYAFRCPFPPSTPPKWYQQGLRRRLRAWHKSPPQRYQRYRRRLRRRLRAWRRLWAWHEGTPHGLRSKIAGHTHTYTHPHPHTHTYTDRHRLTHMHTHTHTHTNNYIILILGNFMYSRVAIPSPFLLQSVERAAHGLNSKIAGGAICLYETERACSPSPSKLSSRRLQPRRLARSRTFTSLAEVTLPTCLLNAPV